MRYFQHRTSTFISWVLFLLIAIQLTEAFTALANLPPPPARPQRFHNREELKRYLQRVHEYYTIVAQPRFGRDLLVKQFMPDGRKDSFDYFYINDDNAITFDEFENRLKKK